MVAVNSPASMEKSRRSTRYLRTCSKGASCRLTRNTAFWISAVTGGAAAISVRAARPLLHSLEGFGHAGVDGEQRRQKRQAVADQQHLADQRLHLKERLDARRVDFLAGGGDDQLFLAAGDEDVAVVVGVSDVAGVQPAIAQNFGGGRRDP